MPPLLRDSVLQFDDFELDCGRFELRRKGEPMRVERKPLELLILLASRTGQLVTRAEIVQRLWSSEVFVDTEHGINTAIRKLRHLLRDDPDDPHFIQTVTGMGYRFIAPVEEIGSPVQGLPAEIGLEASPETVPASRRPRLAWIVGTVLCILVAVAGTAYYRLRHRSAAVRYTQITDFTDSAVAPAISPDGHMVAFIRGADGFLTSDPIYVKLLPHGEARRVTNDSRDKYGLAFSPDGSEIAYTVLEPSGFSTYEVSALGGEPHLLLNNAAGLVWLDPQRVLFSEIQSGIHMGVVSAAATRANLREIYFPAHERGMAHYSFPSPDRRWALVVEMNGSGQWSSCRLIALEGSIASALVGPKGACTAAGWSPDGHWMYFTAAVAGQSHIWRQRFPDGTPEQITSGPTDEEGIAVEPHGRALITSVGVQESAIWIHDRRGDRALSSEGEVAADLSPPVFGPDARVLYYLLRPGEASGAQLWRTQLDSRQSEAVFPGIAMTAFDLSPDGKLIVYTTAAADGTTQLWLAPVDLGWPARNLGVTGATTPHFGLNGQILFRRAEGNLNFLEKVNADGSRHSKVLPYPIEEFQSVSPDRRWVVAAVPGSRGVGDLPAITAIPLGGGIPRRLCTGYCFAAWSTNGKFLFIPVEDSSLKSAGRTLAIPLGADESLAGLPAAGVPPLARPNVARGAKSVARAYVVPGKGPEQYAWVNVTVHRNLYRISLP